MTYMIIIDLLATSLRLAIPIGLAAIGVSICERSGIINLGIEGMMLFGALAAVIASYFTGSAWLGIIFAIIVGGFIGFIYALFCIKFRGSQSVIGIGLNLFATGITVVIVKAIWKQEGLSMPVNQVASIDFPILENIPFIGELFKSQSPFIILVVLIIFLSWFFMYKTKYGLRLRSIGEHPMAAESSAINIVLYRYIAVMICGALASLGGAYLSVVHNNLFVNNMVAGRGFMSIAANIFGGWNPIGSFLASFIFAFAQAIRLTFRLEFIPEEFTQMFPYLLTLIILMGVGRNVRAPNALGVLKDSQK